MAPHDYVAAGYGCFVITTIFYITGLFSLVGIEKSKYEEQGGYSVAWACGVGYVVTICLALLVRHHLPDTKWGMALALTFVLSSYACHWSVEKMRAIAKKSNDLPQREMFRMA